jgi:hypothetical protein
MISREEAKKRIEDSGHAMWALSDVWNEIDRIYDSIGTCKDCDRWERFMPTDKMESRFGQCYLDNNIDNIWGDDDYCSKFERKEQ